MKEKTTFLTRVAMLLLVALFSLTGARAQTLFSEDFEGGAMPTGWTTDGPGTWTVGVGDYSSSTGAGQGSKNALIKHNERGDVTKLITPEIDLSSATNAELSFMYVLRIWSPDTDELRVYYRTSSSGAWTLLEEYTTAVTAWTTVEDIVLPELSSTYQLAFEMKDNFGYGVGIDAIIINNYAYPKPKDLTMGEITATTAAISWTAPAGDVTGYAYQYKKATEGDEAWSTEQTVTSTSVSLSSLDLSTPYNFRVKAVYAGGESDYATINFTTDCNPANLPFTEGFEGEIPCWTLINESEGNASEFGISAAAAQTGSNGFRFSSYSSSSSYNQYLISPVMNATNGVVVQFSYKTSSGTEKFKVGYSTTTNAPSSFTWGDEISTNNTSWTLSEEFAFPAGTKYVAIWYYSVYSYRLFVDDFSFSVSNGLMKPTGLEVIYEGGTEATVRWTSDEDLFDIEVNGETTEDVVNGYVLENLAYATTYTIRVRAKKDGEVSNWSLPVSFTTVSSANSFFINYSLADSYGDGWNGNAINVLDGDGNIVQTLTIASGNSNSGTFDLENGTYYEFVWVKGSYANECSFTFTDSDGNVLFSATSAEANSLANGDVLYVIDSFTISRPTDLAAVPATTSAELSWTENGEATAWQICLNGDETNLIAANSNPFTLNGLTPETTYTVKVRATVGTEFSRWSDEVSFTTLVQFPAPTDLAASHITATSANISWTGSADSYNIRYATSTVEDFFDDFENGLDAQGWTTIRNAEGNEYTDWRTFDPTNFGDESVTSHSGDYVAMSRSWSSDAYSVDNWLISPRLPLGGTMTYWVMDDGQYHEHYDIYVSTTTTDISAFTKVYEPGDASDSWTQVSVDLSSFAGQEGYVAFRHTDNDQDFLFIDDVTITAPLVVDTWTTVNGVTSPYALEGLTLETQYVVQVQAVYADGESGWTSPVTFTTTSPNDAPTDLAATDVKATSATLDWAGSQENYNLQYREALPIDPTAPATIILNCGDVWGDGSGYQMLLDADATAYGDVFPETGGGGWTATDFSAFEYMIPVNAECDMNTTAVVFNNSVTIQIPAGTYDWCILNPSPGDKIYIAAQNGNVGGRQNDYVFEAGKTYEFVPSIYGANDGVDVTITRPMSEWTVVENVTAPYELTGLAPETYYEWQVQGNLADGTTEWSELSSFTTPEEPASVTVGSALYTTYVAPSDVSFPAELTAYIVTSMTETAAVLQEVSAIPAGAAVVVKAEAAGTYYLDAATTTDDMTGNMLKASDGTVQGASNIYALANKSKGIGFYPVASTVTIPAGKAYLETELSKAKAFYGFFEDDATAIDNLNAGVDADETIYNVAGQRISKKQKGVNIVNGKKILF